MPALISEFPNVWVLYSSASVSVVVLMSTGWTCYCCILCVLETLLIRYTSTPMSCRFEFRKLFEVELRPGWIFGGWGGPTSLMVSSLSERMLIIWVFKGTSCCVMHFLFRVYSILDSTISKCWASKLVELMRCSSPFVEASVPIRGVLLKVRISTCLSFTAVFALWKFEKVYLSSESGFAWDKWIPLLLNYVNWAFEMFKNFEALWEFLIAFY